MRGVRRFVTSAAVVVGSVGVAAAVVIWAPARAADKKAPDAAGVERARTTVRMLDDLYKTAVVSITENYVESQYQAPAASVAKDIFKAMKQKGWHEARLIDATGKPKNKDNRPRTDFEKAAVAKLKAGDPYFEEVAERDGKRVLRAATAVPMVMKQCTFCHKQKEGELVGALVYEVPID